MSLVEYYDPDGLFPLIAKQLQDHLPLDNLHWASPSGAVRSIDNLHLDFVPGAKRSQNAPSSAARGSQEVTNESAQAGRRHQLPGLRQTPFLKIYILRCDDKEAYKSTKRDALRSWLADNATSYTTSGTKAASKQEKHDAFEWLILHLVLPNTIAATEPRWTRDSNSDLDLLKEKSSGGARWPGKRPRSILERLRADFNPTSKSAPDHVAQVRLKKDEVPLDVGPELSPPGATTYAESIKERENAWTDLIAKLKSSILRSFDARVNQYEDDVQEKDSQRSLPGWNFCTFFVLKEGLARVFESIGLVEDALRGYEELSAGLDSVLEDQSLGQATTQSTTFATFTDDLSTFGNRLVRDDDDTSSSAASALDRPFDPLRKNYRELIVANKISVFDFKCYIFSRRLSLMIRLGKPRMRTSLELSVGTGRDADNQNSRRSSERIDFEDMSMLATITRLGMETIPLLSRLLRQDITRSIVEPKEPQRAASAIDVTVAAWTYAAARQLFSQTDSAHFNDAKQAVQSAPKASSPRLTQRSERDFNLKAGANGLTLPNTLSPGTSSDLTRSAIALRNTDLLKAAADRAEYCLVQRRTLLNVLTWRQWNLQATPNPDEDVEPQEDALPKARDDEASASPASMMLDKVKDAPLANATSTLLALKSEYELLSDEAAKLFAVSGRQGASEQLVADLARLKFDDGDFLAVVSLLGPLLTSLRERRWSMLENSVLELYATSLKMLNRKDDFVRTALLLVSKNAETRSLRNVRPHALQHEQANHGWLNENDSAITQLFHEVAEYAQQLPYELQLPLPQYFTPLDVDQHINLYEDKDGFSLTVELQPLAADMVRDAKLSLCLYAQDETEGSDIWLESAEHTDICHPATRISLTTNVTTFGVFKIGKLVIRTGKLMFVHEAMRKPQPHNPLILPQSEVDHSTVLGRTPPILCYPRAGALQVDMRAARVLHMGKPRSLELQLTPGQDSIRCAKIMMRSCTAGLRLHTGEATSSDGDLAVTETNITGTIRVGELSQDSKGTIIIPFDTAHDHESLTVGLEVQYETIAGSYKYFGQKHVPVRLLLDVNVQDIFREDYILSKFYLSPTGSSPVCISRACLEDSDTWRVDRISAEQEDTLALRGGSVCVSHRVVPSTKAMGNTGQDATRVLPLMVSYRSTREDVKHQLRHLLTQALESSSFQGLQVLLLTVLDHNVEEAVSQKALEDAALLGECDLPSFESMDWSMALEAIPVTRRAELLKWLRQWHEEHNTFDIQHSTSPYTLRIDFEVPSLDFVHTASIDLQSNSGLRNPLGQPSALVGTAIPSRLTIRSTDRWGLQHDAHVENTQLFEYRLDYDPTAWIVAGPTQIAYKFEAGKTRTFDITLIALRPGSAALPIVEVIPKTSNTRSGPQIAPNTSLGDGPGSAVDVVSPAFNPTRELAAEYSNAPSPRVPNSGDGVPVSCETFCTTAGNAIQVVHGISRVTTGIGDLDQVEVWETRQQTLNN